MQDPVVCLSIISVKHGVANRIVYLSIQKKRRRRSILASRAKRLRYKANKKAKVMWSKQLAQLWKDRADTYAKGSLADNTNDGGENFSDGGSITDHLISAKNAQVDSAAVNECYENTQRDCELDGMHLLPSIMLPETSKSVVEDRFIECTKERDQALKDALQYRNLVENLETNLSELRTTMHHRVAAVRDFWRNKVLEGGSRSGKILKRSLKTNLS